MAQCRALVLGGGGARGAMQVGALRALFEAGYKPDLLVGTSIGAVNAAALALWGADLVGVDALERAYQEIAEANLMDPRLGRLALRALSGRRNHHATRRVADLLISKGFTPDFRFGQVANLRLVLIGADLNSGRPVFYGQDPGQSVLEGMLASIALPPWFAPVEKNNQFIVDGGAVSNLPIEPALKLGATEIIALDLNDPTALPENVTGPNQYIEKLVSAVTQREIYLEAALAKAQGVPLHRLQLRSTPAVQLWDFGTHRELVHTGYEIALHEIAGWRNNGREKHQLPKRVREDRRSWEPA